MAITRLSGQDAKNIATGTPSATYPGATTAGDLLVAVAFSNIAGGNITVTGWTKEIESAGGSNSYAIFWKIADGSETTVTISNGGTNHRINIYEYTGNVTSSVVDGSNSGISGSATSATGPSVTTAQTDDLVLAMFGPGNAITINSSSFNAPFSKVNESLSPVRLFVGENISNSPGSIAATASWTTNANTNNLIIAFKSLVSPLAISKSETITLSENVAVSRQAATPTISVSESIKLYDGIDKIINGGFETGSGSSTGPTWSVSGWSLNASNVGNVISIASDAFYSGVQAVKIAVDASNTNNGINLTTAVRVVSGSTGILSLECISDTAGQLQIQLRDDSVVGSGNYLQADGVTWSGVANYFNINTTTRWTRFELPFTAPTTGKVRISDLKRSGVSTQASRTFWVDEINIIQPPSVTVTPLFISSSDNIALSENSTVTLPFLLVSKSEAITVTETVTVISPTIASIKLLALLGAG